MQDLNKLFYWHGIAEDYFNYKGDLVKVPLENRLNLLRTMGVNVDSQSALAKAAFSVDVAPWLHWLPRLITHPQKEPPAFYIHVNPREINSEFVWSLKQDEKELATGKVIAQNLEETGDYRFQNTRYTRRRIPVASTPLEPGYYQLEMSDGKKTESCCLAVIPDTSWQPYWVSSRDKLWGLIIQLYTLRSSKDWGIGDFGDLQQLIDLAVGFGMDVIGLNPLHTLLPDVEHNCSPYSPSDRRFLNPLYIDVERTEDFVAAGLARELTDDTDHAAELERLRAATHVDYSGVKNLKYSVFEDMYAWFSTEVLPQGGARAREFTAFVHEGGAALLALGVYEAMHNRWKNAGYTIDFIDGIWQAENSADIIRTLAEEHSVAVQFHLYLQWLSALQLQACQNLAREKGMKLGLVRDLAVGANRSGCEVLSNSSLFSLGASVGAPPDPFSDLGQNWGIPPMDPAALRQSGYRHFIDLLKGNMSSCGALRIDHAMSLLRLWWCPPNETADKGAYVYYPFEDLLGLLKLESWLNRCVIIGEDLGVVPPEFRENMGKAKIFANKVFYFEKEHFHFFKPPQVYDEHALAMVNNHDVPTLKSWWDGSDLKLRDKLRLFEEGVDYPQMRKQRREEKQQACNLLKSQNLFPASWETRDLEESADEDIIYALLKLNSRVNSQIFVIQLEDLLLMDAPTNVPGTFKEYPNWQRKIVSSLDQIFNNSRVQAILQEIQQERTNHKE